MIKKQIHTVILIVLILGLAACVAPASPTPTPRPLVAQLRWTHQSQFAGFYAAEQLGYYDALGLDVTFVEGGPTVNVLDSLFDGTAQFAVQGADVGIIARADLLPARAIATIFRRNPLVYFTLAESGITRPQDFVGKTIRATNPSLPTLHSVTARVGVTPDQYTIICCDIEDFYDGTSHISSGFLTNEVIVAQQAGHSLNIIYPDDYGVHFYADTIFATDKFLQDNGALAEDFLRATLDGWRYAVENPDEAAAFTLLYAPDADLEQETLKMVANLSLVNTGEDYIGWMKPEIWNSMHGTLLEQGLLNKDVAVDDVYTLTLLQAIYQSPP